MSTVAMDPYADLLKSIGIPTDDIPRDNPFNELLELLGLPPDDDDELKADEPPTAYRENGDAIEYFDWSIDTWKAQTQLGTVQTYALE